MLITLSLARCAPGKHSQFMELARDGMKLFERHGARGPRMLQALDAGEGSDVFVLTSEFEGAEQHGEFVDALHLDPEFESYTSRSSAADSAMTVFTRMLGGEVPLGLEGPTGRGTIVTAYIRRAHPGRFEECCNILRDLFVFLAEHGGSNCRLFQLDAAGTRTAQLLACWEADSMRTRGKVLDAFGASSAGSELALRMRSADAPMSVVWSGLYRDLQLSPSAPIPERSRK
jgi:hypothetical protein